LYTASQTRKDFAMPVPSVFSDNNRYEEACDQAIAMCDGNVRSTIKALIMANEFLETEVAELQDALATCFEQAKNDAA
jgi:hypothetical protein